jgi:hypothetical protein
MFSLVAKVTHIPVVATETKRKNLKKVSTYYIVDPLMDSVENGRRPICLSLIQEMESVDRQLKNKITLQVFWNDSWDMIYQKIFTDLSEAEKSYSELAKELSNLNKLSSDDVTLPDAKEASAKFLEKLEELSAVTDVSLVGGLRNAIKLIKKDNDIYRLSG